MFRNTPTSARHVYTVQFTRETKLSVCSHQPAAPLASAASATPLAGFLCGACAG